MRFRMSIVILFGVALSVLVAQGPLTSIPPETVLRGVKNDNGPAATLRVDTSLVLVPVMVTDHADQLVLGLNRADFKVYDDKIEQQISHFYVEDAPVSVVVVVDTSASMGRKLQISRLAVREFLNTSNPHDEFAMIEFADRAKVAIHFTDEAEDIQNRLLFLQASGRTALIDAVWLALDEMKFARCARKAIIIVSDGGDNHSRHKKSELKKRVREADVQIYSIGVLDPITRREMTPEEWDGPDLLSDIAAQTGGRLLQADSPGGITEVARLMGAALRNQYVLGYSPSTMSRDGRQHTITVKMQQEKGQRKLRASFRTSYLAPPD